MYCTGSYQVGSVASKNTKSILSKNLVHACLGAICWFFVGYAFAFGEDTGDGWIGKTGFGGTGSGLTVQRLNADGSLPMTQTYEDGSWWVFQFSFCATSATIVSGAVAERMDLRAYFVYTITITALIYPIVAHWAWGPGGWAQSIQADGKTVAVIDFAGSGVVHMTGGMAALVGAFMLGPRTGRFDDNNIDWSGQNAAFQTLGEWVPVYKWSRSR
jgi:Amt family ammonium transporter